MHPDPFMERSPVVNPAPVPDEPSTADLIRKALGDMQELARAEVALAGKELGAEAKATLFTSVALSATIAVGVVAVAVGVGALVAAFGGTTVAAFACTAGVLSIAAGIGLAMSLAQWPKGLLPRTRRRLGEDISQLKDHLAS
jgi:uncharacterized membrane protein YqjE